MDPEQRRAAIGVVPPDWAKALGEARCWWWWVSRADRTYRQI